MPAKPDWSAALAHLASADARFAPLIAAHGAPDLARRRDPLRSLSRAIVGQQLSSAAAATIWSRVLAYYGGKLPAAAAIVATPDADLRAAGLSGAKTAAIKDLAQHVLDRKVIPARLTTLPDHEVSAMLLPVRGIGPWSIDMFLMFSLARPDVLPVGDLGVRKGMQRHFRLRALPDAAKMTKLAQPWRPFRSIGSWYMWRILES